MTKLKVKMYVWRSSFQYCIPWGPQLFKTKEKYPNQRGEGHGAGWQAAELPLPTWPTANLLSRRFSKSSDPTNINREMEGNLGAKGTLSLQMQEMSHLLLSQQTILITVFKNWTFLATLSGSCEHFWQPEWVLKATALYLALKINTFINIPKPISLCYKAVYLYLEQQMQYLT